MKKIFFSLVVAAGYLFAADNAAAAIAVIGTPNPSNQMLIQFDGATLTLNRDFSVYGLTIQLAQNSDTGVLRLNNWNSVYLIPDVGPIDGFTITSVNQGSVISGGSTYNVNQSGLALPSNNYFGFKYGMGLSASPVYHYGWVNLTVSGTGSNAALTLNSAAINTIAGESILAGQTAVTAVPEPRMWMPSLVLVLGVAFRRRRSRSKAMVV